jgi:hypothetical protein
MMKIKAPKNLTDLIYNGVQKIPGEPDQYVFTEKTTKSTFYSQSLDPSFLQNEGERMRRKFKEAAPIMIYLSSMRKPNSASSFGNPSGSEARKRRYAAIGQGESQLVATP